jgi:FkbM family methyltransferase
MNTHIFPNNPGEVNLKIFEFFRDKKNGFFIEAGALDGIFQSNTQLLEQIGWNGILVEPSEAAYLNCVKNRKCIIEHCALVSFDYSQDHILGDFYGDGALGLGARNKVTETGGVRVKAKTLQSILSENNITQVDFFSLDVEGYEMEVLKGIDFNKTTIDYILIEVNSDSYSLEEINLFMLSKGYENIANVSCFAFDTTPGWPGNHQDYLFKKI